MNKFALLLLLLLPAILLSGCNSRSLKTAVCYAKLQPEENKCLYKLASDTKDTVPCDKITEKFDKNGTMLFPSKVACYSEVAYRKGEETICDQLPKEDSRSECKHQFNLYVEAEKYRNVNQS